MDPNLQNKIIKDLQEKYENLKNKRRIEILNFDKTNYLQLLKKKDKSEQESQQLLEYSALLNIEIDWQTLNQYVELVEKFLKRNISILDFCIQFCERHLVNTNAVKMLESNFIILSPDERSLDFSDFIEDIYFICQEFDWDQEDSENEFRNSIEKTFVRMKQYLNES
jgi:hypothetical protein